MSPQRKSWRKQTNPPHLRRARNNERGTHTVEFVVLFPLCLFFLITTLEISWMAMRAATFERGVDIAMREIRLNTFDPPDYEEVKTIICGNAPAIDGCLSNLRLELIRVDPRAWNGNLQAAACSDQSEEVDPPDPLTVGLENDIMVLRACARLAPLLPNSFSIGGMLELGEDGRFPVFSINAFVQEPT